MLTASFGTSPTISNTRHSRVVIGQSSMSSANSREAGVKPSFRTCSQMGSVPLAVDFRADRRAQLDAPALILLRDLNQVAAGVVKHGRGDRSHLDGRLSEVNSG
jgi:hypothetical protein